MCARLQESSFANDRVTHYVVFSISKRTDGILEDTKGEKGQLSFDYLLADPRRPQALRLVGFEHQRAG